MANRTNRPRFLRQVSRRQTEWGIFAGSTAVQGIGTSAKVVLASFSSTDLAGLIPGTIVRTRGVVHVSAQSSASSAVLMGAFGFALVNDVAEALGITALPGPFTNQNFDWFYWQPFASRQLVGTNIGFDSLAGKDFIIDSKAMRKLGNGDSLIMMVENASGANAIDVAFSARLLVKAG